MGRVFVVGVGMSKFVKPGTGGDYPDYAKEALCNALKDANVTIEQIQRAYVGYVYGDSCCGQRVIYESGMTGMPIFNVNNNCSTGATALLTAKEAIEFNVSDCVLALGFEKMERGGLKFKFHDRSIPLEKHTRIMSDIHGVTSAPLPAQYFSHAGMEHMKKYGTRLEHFAKIAYKNHNHSVNNPYAQFRDRYSLDEILKSPKIFGLLTKLQCCPTSDGAAAAVLASEHFVRSHGLESRAVEILGMEMCTDLPSSFDKTFINLVGFDMTRTAAQRTFRKANRKPSDVQVVELHDCFSVNELLTYEALGLCELGKAGEMIDRGDNTYGGKYVVNPSGGLISKGHPLGATGIAQCAELCWQLRGEAENRQVQGAKLALQHNLGLGGAIVVALYALGMPSQNNDQTRKEVTMRIVERGFTVAPYFKILEQVMLLDEQNTIDKFRGIYGFKIQKSTGEEEYWLVNTKTGKGTVEFNNISVKPDVTFTSKEEDIVDLLTGKMDVQQAFSQGKIKLHGNIELALKLTELRKIALHKLNAVRAKL
ncbi:hypothetical protein PPYR_05694 [Photinus pyralis]|uniref:Sterol carrier protein 2 n=3 Tax=Photinus pyralis TaxID=7054 RepID=A0A5N4AVT4_PHOPY|nr:non-specific lipid-transfer protein-like [Photinus pyralis]KAB0801340.1 hypothetical protein PPYR_05694 [Photinus pyralis]